MTPPAGFINYLGVTSLSAYATSGNDIYAIGQNIEGFNIADLGWGTANAKTVTLSFWVRSSLTGTFGGAINANIMNSSIIAPSILILRLWDCSRVKRGRECFSNHLIILINLGNADFCRLRGIVLLSHLFGSHNVFLPAMSSIQTSIAIISKM